MVPKQQPNQVVDNLHRSRFAVLASYRPSYTTSFDYRVGAWFAQPQHGTKEEGEAPATV